MPFEYHYKNLVSFAGTIPPPYPRPSPRGNYKGYLYNTMVLSYFSTKKYQPIHGLAFLLIIHYYFGNLKFYDFFFLGLGSSSYLPQST